LSESISRVLSLNNHSSGMWFTPHL